MKRPIEPASTRRHSAITRRDVLRGGLAAAAAAPALSSSVLAALSRSGAVHARGSDTLRVGLIGCGGRGSGAATQALDADPGVIVTAMADAFPERVESCLVQLREHDPQRVQVDDGRKFVGFDAYRQLIDSGVDVVILATPVVFRPMHLKAAVDAGKHVFCEKPMAVDAPGVRSVLASAAEAKRRNLSLVAGFCWRYSDAERATFHEIHEGRIGAVRAVHTSYNTSGWVEPKPRDPNWSEMEYCLRNWHYFYPLSGDHVVEQACHSIDKIAWAMNDRTPARCTTVGGRAVRTMGNVYDHFGVTYEYDDGARAFHTCRQIENTPFDNSDYVMGEKGFCAINGWAPSHEITGESPWRYEGERRNMYQTEHDELFASIRKGEPINDGVWMAHSTLMSIMARMAAYTGQTITWDQALNSQEDLTPKRWEWGSIEMPPVALPGRTQFI